MKSILSLLLAALVAFGLGACKGKKPKPFAIGKITAMVPAERQMWVDEGKKTRDYYWDSETKVTTVKGPSTVDALQPEDKVRITLKVSGGKSYATLIEVKEKKDKADKAAPAPASNLN